MWLLNTKTLELKEVTDPGEHKYAILSHVWEDSDRTQTFHDIRAIHARCVVSGEDPRSLVTEKVRRFCIFAEREGYEWIWLDTCCIDKSSSAELSEAINSMFAWYGKADVCYAYLCDVSDDDDPRSPGSDFRRSRWHTRGWTLQELIAPRKVFFLSKGWFTIGSKVALVGVLADISGIDRDLLVFYPGSSYVSYSVARRMSWASKRQTTRVEDQAYCLMGLFQITMPIIYGEGERAFVRLQAEILQNIRDDSIFAWGPIHTDLAYYDRGRLVLKPEHLPARAQGGDQVASELQVFDNVHRSVSRINLPLARSPSDFASSADYAHFDSRGSTLESVSMGTKCNYTFTNLGLSVGIPISTHALPVTVQRTSSSIPKVHVAALCCTKVAPEGSQALTAGNVNSSAFVILFLTKIGTNGQHYHIGAEVVTGKGEQRLRGVLVYTRHSEVAALMSVFTMQEVIVVDHNRTHREPERSLWRLPPASDECYHFHIPFWSLRRLQTRYGFHFQGPLVDGHATAIADFVFKPSRSRSETYPSGPASVVFQFINTETSEILAVRFGVWCLCNSHLRCISPSDWWIDVRVEFQANSPGNYTCQFVPRGHGHNPPSSTSKRRNERCTRRHLFFNPLTEDSQQLIAFDLGIRTVHVQTALTEFFGESLFAEDDSSHITVMIDLEGFERREATLSSPPTTSSHDAHTPPPPPDSASSGPGWLSQSWKSWNLPGASLAGASALASLRSLRNWLASEVDFTYGSLV